MPSTMKVQDLMATEIAFATSCMTLTEAARKMQEYGCGFLPVGSKDKTVGVITDRDIVIRAVSQGKDLTGECVRDYMTPTVVACNEGDTLEDAITKMHESKISRLVVKNKGGHVVGVLSLGEYLSKFARSAEIASVVKHTVGTVAA